MKDMESPRRANGEGSSVNLAGDAKSCTGASAADQLSAAAQAREKVETAASNAQLILAQIKDLAGAIDRYAYDVCSGSLTGSAARQAANAACNFATLTSQLTDRAIELIEEIEVEARTLQSEGH